MMGESLSPVSTITYAALNVMWLDGLDDIRHVQTSAKGNDKADHVSIKWTCRSLDELQWYCAWKGLPSESHHFAELPKVHLSDLIWQLGVPENEVQGIVSKLPNDALSALQRAVLPGFVHEAVELMADQLPELLLMDKFQSNMLFIG